MRPYPNKDILYFAKTNFRNDGKVFGLQKKSMFLHTLITGKTGVGKSEIIKNFCYQLAIQNEGFCVFDIHNDIIPSILKYLPPDRKKDLVYLDIPSEQSTYRYNPLKKVSPNKRSLVASGIIESFKTIYRANWGNRLEYILMFVVLVLLENHATFADIPKLLNNEELRKEYLSNVTNEDVLSFFEHEYPRYSKGDLTSVLNKVMSFLAHPSIRRLLVDNKEDISFRKMMDEGKIVLINVNKGLLGSEVSQLISSLLLTSIMNAGFSRSTLPEEKRRHFFILLDEFQTYSNKSIISLLSEIRKYGLSLTLSTQYISGIDAEIRDALFGNVGNIITFRVSNKCASIFAKEMAPVFKVEDFVSLGNHDIYLRMVIDNKVCKPFSATTIRYFDHF